ncbi:MAG: recombinase family protein [Alphaproteobacteria bacterium]|nr:MAG: recombinase family protein [Alphaproteobacteria bacterium]
MKTKGNTVPLRCAIYTRKSTEEGLEQAFNSLDAQREACEAYAVSQRHEGWQVLNTRYDDGGFSGGNLTRPALQRLLADINEGKVDLVVVYKIDRLTRSLMDFSKLVETFDRHQTSFVSVTQHFNTTSSMGRLTLNVLLSFAQFEREVTGERIRDKVAASKRKGMWMGGPVPLGYALVEKALVVNESEAALVRSIFKRYCQLGCVRALQEELSQANTRGRSRLQRDGATETRAFSRGGLYAVLNRRLYLGEVHHKGEFFEGQHEAIVPAELWTKAQVKLQNNRHQRRTGKRARNCSLLAGMVKDGAGHRLIPTHSTKGDKRYRYYVTRPGGTEKKRLCLPAHDVERIATEQWLQMLSSDELDVQLHVEDPTLGASLRANAERLVRRWQSMDTPEQREILLQANVQVTVNDRRIELSSEPVRLSALLLEASKPLVLKAAPGKAARVIKTVDTSFIKAAGETRILAEETTVIAAAMTPGHKTLLKAIAQGRDWAKDLIAGEIASADDISVRTGLSAAHVARGLKCMNIPSTLIENLVAGKGPPELTWAAVRRLNSTTAIER